MKTAHFRLDNRVYEELEKKVMGTPIVTKETTELQAGFQLGVQHVLKVLRDGYTVNA